MRSYFGLTVLHGSPILPKPPCGGLRPFIIGAIGFDGLQHADLTAGPLVDNCAGRREYASRYRL